MGILKLQHGVKSDHSTNDSIQVYTVPKDSNETKRLIWAKECQQAFETSKQALVKPFVLQYPNFPPENRFILKTDASGYAIGAVLSNGDDRPVAFISRSLKKISNPK